MKDISGIINLLINSNLLYIGVKFRSDCTVNSYDVFWIQTRYS